MTSTFTGIEIGKRSLTAHHLSMQVLGQNISNSDTDGYSRQRVTKVSVNPLEDPSFNRAQRSGQIGQGVEVSQIRRDRDLYLDKRIFTEGSNETYWSTRENLLGQIENIHQSLDDVQLQDKLDLFWGGWQDLVNNPTELAIRTTLSHRSQDLTNHIRSEFSSLFNLREELNMRVETQVNEINALAGNIATLNGKIVRSQNMEDNPNDWLDQRDRFVERLSHLTDIQVRHRDNDETMIFLDGKILVQGTKVSKLHLEEESDNDGYLKIAFELDGPYKPKGGELGATMDIRDGVIKDQMRRLNTVASSLIYEVNEIHEQGFDNYQRAASPFFITNNLSTDPNANFDLNQDGQNNVTMIYSVAGDVTIDGNKEVGENGVLRLQKINSNDTVDINYSFQERINDVIDRINASEAGVNAYINYENRLVIKARSTMSKDSFSIKHLEDSGQFLVGLTGILDSNGEAGAFDYNAVDQVNALKGGIEKMKHTPLENPASYIRVSSNIIQEPNNIASSAGYRVDADGKALSKGTNNTEIAQRISDIRYSKRSMDNSRTFNEFYVDMVNDVATDKNISQMERVKFSSITDNLKDLRQSISGVNLDEEMANMLSLQHGYQAAARIINTVDQMIDTIIRMGA